jgi:hypothetical protein
MINEGSVTDDVADAITADDVFYSFPTLNEEEARPVLNAAHDFEYHDYTSLIQHAGPDDTIYLATSEPFKPSYPRRAKASIAESIIRVTDNLQSLHPEAFETHSDQFKADWQKVIATVINTCSLPIVRNQLPYLTALVFESTLTNSNAYKCLLELCLSTFGEHAQIARSRDNIHTAQGFTAIIEIIAQSTKAIQEEAFPGVCVISLQHSDENPDDIASYSIQARAQIGCLTRAQEPGYASFLRQREDSMVTTRLHQYASSYSKFRNLGLTDQSHLKAHYLLHLVVLKLVNTAISVRLHLLDSDSRDDRISQSHDGRLEATTLLVREVQKQLPELFSYPHLPWVKSLDTVGAVFEKLRFARWTIEQTTILKDGTHYFRNGWTSEREFYQYVFNKLHGMYFYETIQSQVSHICKTMPSLDIWTGYRDGILRQTYTDFFDADPCPDLRLEQPFDAQLRQQLPGHCDVALINRRYQELGIIGPEVNLDQINDWEYCPCHEILQIEQWPHGVRWVSPLSSIYTVLQNCITSSSGQSCENFMSAVKHMNPRNHLTQTVAERIVHEYERARRQSRKQKTKLRLTDPVVAPPVEIQPAGLQDTAYKPGSHVRTMSTLHDNGEGPGKIRPATGDNGIDTMTFSPGQFEQDRGLKSAVRSLRENANCTAPDTPSADATALRKTICTQCGRKSDRRWRRGPGDLTKLGSTCFSRFSTLEKRVICRGCGNKGSSMDRFSKWTTTPSGEGLVCSEKCGLLVSKFKSDERIVDSDESDEEEAAASHNTTSGTGETGFYHPLTDDESAFMLPAHDDTFAREKRACFR